MARPIITLAKGKVSGRYYYDGGWDPDVYEPRAYANQKSWSCELPAEEGVYAGTYSGTITITSADECVYNADNPTAGGVVYYYIDPKYGTRTINGNKYKFLCLFGWFDSSGYQYSPEYNNEIAAWYRGLASIYTNVVIPIYLRLTWTASFDGNGGTPARDSKPVEFKVAYGTLPTAVRPGYTFAGWYTEAEGGTRVTSETLLDDCEDVTLYAHWTANGYTVEFDANGGSGEKMAGQSMVFNESEALTANSYTRTGYRFLGWSTSSDVTTPMYADGETVSNLTVVANSTVTLYAVWGQAALTYKDESGAVTATQRYYGDVSLLAPVSRVGYTFLKWKIGGTEYDPGDTFNLIKDTTAVGIWTNISILNNNPEVGTLSLYDVTEDETVANESGGWLMHRGESNHIYRIDCTLSSELYAKRGVRVDGEYYEPYSFRYTSGNVSLTYSYRELPLYSVLVSSTTAGCTGSVTSPATADKDGKYVEGRQIQITGVPANGYVFSRAALLNATTGYNEGEALPVDNVVTIPSLGYNLRAILGFEKVAFTVSATIDAASAEAVTAVAIDGRSADGGANYGDTVLFSATVADGYSFAGWYEGDTLVSENATYSHIVTATITLTAKAKVNVVMSLVYDGEGSESCTMTVDGSVYTPGTGFYVVLGGSFEYELTLGYRIGTTHWAFDGWYADPDDVETALPYSMSGTITPTVAIDMTARLAETTTKTLKIFVVEMGDNTNSLVAKSEQPDAIEIEGETPTAATDAFTYEFDSAQVVMIKAADSLTFNGVEKSFYGFVAVFAESFDGAAIPPDADVLARETEYSTVASKAEFAIYAYYGEPHTVETTISFVEGSGEANGTIAVVATDVTDPAAQIAADGLSAIATQGKTITLQATPKNGYLFEGWFLDAQGSGTAEWPEAQAVVRVTGERMIYAKFVPDAHAVYEWEGSQTNKVTEWRSKTYVASKPFNPSALRVDALGYRPEALLTVSIEMFSSPNAVTQPSATTTISNLTSQDARRLPVKRPERFLQVCVESDDEVDAVLVGTSMGGIAI